MDPAFVEKEFRNWKKCQEAFTSHKTPKYHRGYVKLLNDEETANDSAGELSNIRKKSKHQIIFLQVL